MDSSSDILRALDALAESFDFPGFNNMNYETADARLHCFRDDTRWALVIEQIVDWPGAGGPVAITRTMGDPQGEAFRTRALFEFELDDEVPASVRLRGQEVRVDRAKATALAEEHAVGTAFAVLVLLREEHRDVLFATPAELADGVGAGLVPLLTLEAWSHPDVYGGPKPSEAEAFRQLAEVLATGDVTRYAPTEAPNNRDWKMWLASH